ncbi:methionyl-tRNA formyltransferase [Candidatus Parcubacteria bacterium]|jgi:methionyl-tRNA formyltransferase|nr:methionyl-tRNA formyltransferase [Candidatus Parcubacteria bacterium]MBT3948855.1 methionyl-tRNA formyltransferase [Candidatus Parcubacteria bacterium]
MQKIKTVFFGTHDFAVTILQGLLGNPLFDIELVITQPDRPAGRKQKLQASPVKIFAEKNNLKIDQPPSLKNYELGTLNSELFIVAQYGLLIPKSILDAPKHGTINVHTSLLPKYRGASPIQSAILNGDKKTGVTIMLMDEGMDSGPILTQKEIDILPNETYLELDSRLAKIGSDTLLNAIPKYISDEVIPQTQDESQITLCQKLSREDGKVSWNKTTEEIYNQYRALTPWPGVWTVWNDKRLKLLEIKPSEKKIKPGKVVIENDILFIGTKNSSIQIFKLQLEGKPSMDVKTFVNGYRYIDKTSLS